MGADDDIHSALPRPPMPAPARRDAAIAAALRRFDGLGEAPPERAAPPAPSWQRRPYFGALAGAALVALIALPFAWSSLDEQPYRDVLPSPPAGEAGRPEPAAADIAAPSPEPASPSVQRDEPVQAGRAVASDEAPAPLSADAAKAASEPAPVAAPPAPAEPLADRQEDRAPPPAETGSEELVVTGSRIRQPNLGAAAPLAVADSPAPATAGRMAAARPARRGDWNACTVEDPGRRLAGCLASGELAEGLERAWQGDWDGAARAFDSAVAAAPRSSAAWLNRGLVHRRRGDLDRALADLDRAVRFSPRSARAYYQRSLVHRQRGDLRRALADEARAAELDPRYSALVGGR